MSSEIIVAGVRFVSVRDAATGVEISADYISRLCRKGVVHGRLEGREWYVNPASLSEWRANQARRKDALRERTRELRKEERANGHAVTSPITVAPHRELNDRFKQHIKRAQRVRAAGTAFLATLTLFAVMASGALAFQNIAPQKFAAAVDAATHAPENIQSQLAAVASLPWIDALASNVFNAVCPIIGNCSPTEIATPSTQQHLQPPTGAPPPPATTLSTSSEKGSSPTTKPATLEAQRSLTVVNNPVIERIRETVRTVTEGGINAALLDARMTALATSLQSQIASVAAASHSESQTIYQTVGSVGRIEELTDTKLHSPTIDGGTISGATITGGSITATDFSGVLAIAKGGTATSASPTYGQLLLGNSSGGYNLAATSSLGITSGGGGLASYDAWTHAVAGQSATTSLVLLGGGASTTALSSLDGIFVGRTATTTILGSATSTFGAGLQTTALNVTSTTATSTFANGIRLAGGLTLSGLDCSSSGQLLQTDANGNVICGSDDTAVGSASPFTFLSNYGQLAAATSSIIWAQSGLFASSTSHFVNADFTNATATNATSTNLFATLGRFTTGIIDTLSSVAATITNLTSTTLVATNATTTRLDAFDYVAIGRTATTTIRGDGIASSLPFASTTMITATTASSTNLWISGINSGSLLKTTTGGQVTSAVAGTDYAAVSSLFGKSWEVSGNFLAPTTTTYVTNIQQASSTLLSALQAKFGATASTTIDTAGNVAIAGTLDVTGKATLGTASTTNLSATYASSTSGFFGNLSIGALSGFLKATAGSITTALVDLASNVTGILGVSNGGTGWANVASGAVVLGNGTGPVATTSAGTNGQVLGLVSGTPTWVSTTTLANISGTLGVASGGTGLTSYTLGDVLFASGTGTLAGTSTANLKSTLALNNVENTALSTWAGSTNVTTLGTIGTGTWNATTIAANKGGTGLSSFTSGDLLYANSASSLTTLASSTDGLVLTLQNGKPSWIATSTLSTITGTLTIAKGGTGTTTAPVSQLLYGGSTAYQSVATSSLSAGTALSFSGTAGALVGGSNLTINFAAPAGTALSIPFASTTMLSATTASTTALVISNTGGTGTRCLQVGSDGTVSANASACGSGSGGDPFTHAVAGTSATTTLTLFNGGASTTMLSAYSAYFGGTATTTFTASGNALFPASGYLNFGATEGTSGYGFRDNAGMLEFKNSGGTWQGVTTATSGPSFSVNKNGTDQTVSANVDTALTWSTETFDTNNNFASNKFTPTVPGKYIITLSVRCGDFGQSVSVAYCDGSIYKNAIPVGVGRYRGSSFDATGMATAVVDMNGTTDYIEARGTTDGTIIDGTAAATYFTGALIAPVNATAGGWQNDNTQSFLADSTDLVGIGTSTPYSKLTLWGSDTSASTQSFLVANSASTTLFQVNNDGSAYSAGKFGIATTSPWAQLSVHAAAGINSFAIGSSTATYFLVNSSGNVGIGTTSPAKTLVVSSTGNTYSVINSPNASLSALSFQSDSLEAGGIYRPTSQTDQIRLYTRTGGDVMTLNAGNVGIGTTSPWALLSVNPNALGSGVPEFVIGSSTATHFVVTGGGNVGIGTTTPTGKLDVFGTIRATSQVAPTNGVGTELTWDGTSGQVRAYDRAGAVYKPLAIEGSTLSLNANSAGNVGIGATSDGSKLYLSWNASTQQAITMRSTSASYSGSSVLFLNTSGGVAGNIAQNESIVSYNTSSDRRIKENIATTTLGLDALMRLTVRDFDFITDPAHATTTGFIAQELQQVFPWAVTTNGDNGIDPLGATSTPWSVDYGRITPLLAKAIQDLNLKLEDLATTTPEIPEGTFTSRFFASLFARLTQWLADATNGIGEVFARVFRAKDALCINDTCVNEDQLKAMLSASAAGAATTGPGGSAGAPGGSSALEIHADTASTTPSTDSSPTATSTGPTTPTETGDGTAGSEEGAVENDPPVPPAANDNEPNVDVATPTAVNE